MIPGQPQVPRRHARPGTPGESSPQRGHGTRRRSWAGTLVRRSPEPHLWLPRNMEQSNGNIARTVWGNVALTRHERERHVYLIGKSGSGKSTTLFNLAMHDIAAGEGVAV